MESRDRSKKMGIYRIECNLCRRTFRAASQFQRFCRVCRDDELFRFYEYLPLVGQMG